jgi:SAM-dependent methyltransferase
MATDRWAVGELYEPYMGRWSRLVAAQFVPLLGVPAGSDWVDVGCGTGALSTALLDLGEPRSVVGVDPSEGFVDYACHHISDPRFRGAVAYAADLGLPADSADAVVSGLVLNFVPLPVTALEEAARVVRPGGLVGGYVWDYAEGMGMLRAFWDAAMLIDPDAGEAAEGARFPLCRPEPLQLALLDAGLVDARVEAIDTTAQFQGFDGYWAGFMGGQGPAGSYVVGMDPGRREALRARLRERLLLQHALRSDGSIELPLRAWAYWGRRA